MTELHISVHKSINEIDESEWNSIVPAGKCFQKYRTLMFFEDGGLIDCPPRYFCIRNDAGELLAHVTAYLIRTSLVIFSKGLVRGAVDWIRNIWPTFLRPRTLEFGCPISPGNSFCSRDINFSELHQLLVKAAKQEASKSNIKIVVFRDFYQHDLLVAKKLAKNGFIQIAMLPTTILRVRWRNFDDYLQDMRARYRAKVRRGLSIANRSDLSVRISSSFSEDSEQLADEWRNVHEHADEYSREELTPQFYRGIGKAMHDECRLIEVLRGGNRVAHALVVFDGEILRWLFFGRSRPEERDGAYFLVIAAVIELAIQERLDIVEMGLTTYFPKTDFGAEMVPLWAFALFRGAIFGKLMPIFVHFFNPIPEIMNRTVFRKDIKSLSKNNAGNSTIER